jgi:hypothetical protein
MSAALGKKPGGDLARIGEKPRQERRLGRVDLVHQHKADVRRRAVIGMHQVGAIDQRAV